MPHAEQTTRAVVEIVCDESGSEGEKLVGGSTDVFAHASVVVTPEVALACIERVRVEARSPATEIKASVILRQQNRRLLEWLLDPHGPLQGAAHVHLTDKAFHLTRRLLDLFGEPTTPEAAATRARALHRRAPTVVGEQAWYHVLVAFNELMRSRELISARLHLRELTDRLEAALTAAPTATAAPAGTALAGALADVAAGLPATDGDLVRLLDRTSEHHVLDPLVPALAVAVAHWGRDGARVRVVHDVQATLTHDRLAHLDRLVADGRSERVDVRFVDSQTDPRVQVADFMAGAARRIAAEALHGRADAGLTRLLRPYVDAGSPWGDDASWLLLGPVAPDATRASPSAVRQ